MATESRSKTKQAKAKTSASPAVKATPTKKRAAGKTAAPPQPKKGNGKAATMAAAPATPAGVEQAAPTAPPAATPRQAGGPGEVLGEVTWLMTRSAMHKHLFLADLEWLILPPVAQKQFRLFRNGAQPFAFACWAFLNEEGEQRLKAGQQRLRPSDWRSGDRAWLIDIVAPFGNVDGVLANLKQSIFKERRLMAMRLAPDGKGMVAVEVTTAAKEAVQKGEK